MTRDQESMFLCSISSKAALNNNMGHRRDQNSAIIIVDFCQTSCGKPSNCTCSNLRFLTGRWRHYDVWQSKIRITMGGKRTPTCTVGRAYLFTTIWSSVIKSPTIVFGDGVAIAILIPTYSCWLIFHPCLCTKPHQMAVRWKVFKHYSASQKELIADHNYIEEETRVDQTRF